MSKKLLWFRNGALIGLAIFLADYFLEWRGQKYVPWTEINATAYNIGQIVGVVGGAAIIGFIAGVFADGRRNNHRPTRQPVPYPEQEYREPRIRTASMNLPIQPRMTPADRRPVNQRNLYSQKPQSSNFIVRYWRGGFSLGISYWMFGFLGGLVVAVIPYLALMIFSPNSGYEPTAILATLVFTWLLVLSVTLWQIVGVWRSANNHIHARLKLGLSSPWAGLAKLAVVIGALNLAAQLYGVAVPQLVEASRITFLNDPDIPDYSIRVMRDGTEAEVTGGFKYGLAEDFSKILSASPQIHVLHLNSIGGRIGEAEKLNQIIRSHSIITYVSASCISACTVAFAGGAERWLREGAVMGFHAPSFPGLSAAELADAKESQRNIFASAGITPTFIDRALSTPNQDLWRPDATELLHNRVITALSYGNNFAASGYGGNISKEELASRVSEYLPSLRSLKVRFPKEYEEIVNSFFDSYAAGRTEAEVNAAARAKFFPLVLANRSLADDSVLIEFGKLLVDQYRELGSKNPEHCYLYATGYDSNFTPEFSSELVKRENQLVNEIFLTAAPRAPISDEISGPLWEKVMMNVQSRVGSEQMNMFQETKLAPAKYAEYCNLVITLYQEINTMGADEAAILIRQAFAAP